MHLLQLLVQAVSSSTTTARQFPQSRPAARLNCFSLSALFGARNLAKMLPSVRQGKFLGNSQVGPRLQCRTPYQVEYVRVYAAIRSPSSQTCAIRVGGSSPRLGGGFCEECSWLSLTVGALVLLERCTTSESI